jgi:hypothetical protein
LDQQVGGAPNVVMLDRGDDEGQLVWAQIRRAIEAL